MPIDVQVLGSLRVTVDGTQVALGGPMPRALLARLLIAAGDTVPASAIIDQLWHSDPPRTASATLQGYVSTLRRGIEPGHGRQAPTILVRAGAGYALVLPDDAVDASRFLDRSVRGHAELAAGRPAAAREHFAGALAMWSGRAYADAEGWEFAEVEADRLETLRADAVDGHLTAMSEVGDQEQVVAEVTSLLRTDPLREKRWELLALAQYRAGRQAEALENLRRARRVFADELGADLGPALAELQTAILRQDPGLLPERQTATRYRSAGVRRDAAPAAPESPDGTGTRRHLPTSLTSFVGRGVEVDEVSALLAGERMVTVIGPGGIGKTRVALAVAQHRDDPDGPWFLEFSGALGIDDIVDTLTRALGLSAPGGLDAVASLLAERRTVLVFDNCEHVADEVAKVALALLSACPDVTVLATSRVRLGVPGEYIYALAPLRDGAELFAERAPAAAAFENRGDIVALCQALDNLPLAIELAAARNSVLSVRQLRERLDDRFVVLRHDRRGSPGAGGDRHISMQAAIDGSYRALDESARALFEALSVFEGSFDYSAAEAVTGHDARLLPDLETLIDSSMITVLGGHPRRYRILETLREYARDHLDVDRADALADAHLRWVRELSGGVYEGLRGPDGRSLMRRLIAEMPNIHTALARCRTTDRAAHLEIAGNIVWFWYQRGHVDEGMRTLAVALGAADDTTIGLRVRLRALSGAMLIGYVGGDLEMVLAAMTELGRLLDAGGLDLTDPDDRFTYADAMATLGNFQAAAGMFEEGTARARAGLEIATDDGHTWLQAGARMVLGTAGYRAGDHAMADRELTEAVRVARSCGYDWAVGSSHWMHAKSDIAQGLIDGPAQSNLAALIEVSEHGEDLTSWMAAVATLAYVVYRRGDHVAAARLRGVVAKRGELTGYVPERMDVIDLAAWVGEMDDAIDPRIRTVEGMAGRELDDRGVAALIATCLA